MKTKIKNTIALNSYTIIDRAVEEGFTYGWGRAHKHTVTPSKEVLQDNITKAIMDSISEVVDWEELNEA